MAKRYVFGLVLAGLMALAVPALAQKPANAPANATAQCGDGTFSTAKTERGACSRHGGAKTWFGAASAEDDADRPRSENACVLRQGGDGRPAGRDAGQRHGEMQGRHVFIRQDALGRVLAARRSGGVVQVAPAHELR